jgi:alkylation response protein AidB-like acyl-CoA dehydrogenase
MSFALSPEQLELQNVVRRFFDDKCLLTAQRRNLDDGPCWDSAVWEQMATQLGLQGLAIPEKYGGQGYSFEELSLVLEECGGALVSAPLLSTTAFAAPAILRAGSDEQRERWLPRIAAGDAVATIAVAEHADWRPASTRTVATSEGATWVLHGTKDFVTDGSEADLVVVVAREAGSLGKEGIGLYVVDTSASQVACHPLQTLDLLRGQAGFVLDGTPAERLALSDFATVSWLLDVAAVGLASEMVGGARRCLDMSVQYAKDRVQFGVPIGSFQAIKHLCADLLLEVEQATAATYHAARAAATDDPELPVAASVAKAYCSDVFTHVATETIQIHGGLGFTWEHDAHLYFRRARADEVLFGDATYHRELVACRLIDG